VTGADDTNGQRRHFLVEARSLLDKLDNKLVEYDAALGEEPRTIDPARAEYLEMLARYAQQLANRVTEVLEEHAQGEHSDPATVAFSRQALPLASALTAKAQERARRTWSQRYAWAAADGRQLRWHHVAGLRQIVAAIDPGDAAPAADPLRTWLLAESDTAAMAGTLSGWAARLDAAFGPGAWRELENGQRLSAEQEALLLDLVRQVPELDAANLPCTLHPPIRKTLLAELGRRNPSLAYRAASHLWARDLARLASSADPWTRLAERILRAGAWCCFALAQAIRTPDGAWKGEALFVPAGSAKTIILLLPDQIVLLPLAEASTHRGLQIEPLETLGLRGIGLARIRLEGFVVPESRTAVDYDRMRRVWGILSSADLTSIAVGMAETLCQRAVAHATSRVQFPGLFHDEAARDTIGKFGAVKKMIAAMEARRLVLETLDHTLVPEDFSASSLEQASLVKALTAEALGTAPGSLSYNAGQVFGGTGFSEDDILAKYYRDAAAWRFLGWPNAEIYHRHGQELLRNWRGDGQRLAGVREEVKFFEQVAQRKALLAELDEVRNARSRIRNVVTEWLPLKDRATGRDTESTAGRVKAWQGDGEEIRKAVASGAISEALARQDGYLLASKALVLRTHARLEQGLPAELAVALLRVWLDEAASALDAFEHDVRLWFEALGRRDDRPVVEVSAGPPVTRYADYLAGPGAYDSGDFLTAPADLVQPRYVPEMLETDERLAIANRDIRDAVSRWFGAPREDGLPYERHIESRHRPDGPDLDFCRSQGWFRLLIPKELGGEGRSKVDYNLVVTNLHRLADVAIALTVQVSTGIGSTPVTLARTKDIPRAQKDVDAFLNEPALHQDVDQRLGDLLKMIAVQNAKALEQGYQALQKRLDEAVLARPILRSACHRFLTAWQEAGRAAKEMQLDRARAQLDSARAAWLPGCARVRELPEELARRRRAYDQFFQWISSGQISAFALTEPGAGSDTARVSTRALLRSVPVEIEADGVLRFIPDGGKEPRYVLDARRLQFPNRVPCYRWSTSAEAAPIHFDEYDYETDNPARMRYYDHGGRRVHFTDIAHLCERAGRLWYDYWELTGAKMWITNGRMAGIMCLYAKTDEGVTGFIVDRHAEGLIVGKDEAKMGQCGSPTNELALQAVRVPREQVIGVEGRGQVNALEALNVGRGSIGVLTVAPMAGLIQASRAWVSSSYEGIPDWAQWRLQRMEENQFIAESITYEVIGRAEHPHTKSVRLESAMVKLLSTELLHQLIELAEEIHGLAGQTQLHFVEKRKRDARVFTIYEGTNEIQRSLILKELGSEVAPRCERSSGAAPQHVGKEALELETLKDGMRQRLLAARQVLGSSLWQNPNLQVNCFLLAEAATWLKAADSVLGRLAWLSRRALPDDNADPSPKGELARRAFARCSAEVACRLRRFDDELTHLRRGFYAPEVRAAELVFERSAETATVPTPASTIERPLAILVVLDSFRTSLPNVVIAEGRPLEPHIAWSDADRSALETALRLRDAAQAPVRIEVAAVGARAMVSGLREALSLGVDRVHLVAAKEPGVTPACAAAALAAVLAPAAPFDLVLGGCGSKDSEDGLTARFTAATLGLPFAGSAEQVAIVATASEASALLVGGSNRQQRVRPLPLAAAVPAGWPLRPYTMAGYLARADKMVDVVRWPKKIESRAGTFAEAAAQAARAAGEQEPAPLTPDQAAQRVLTEIGATGTAVAPQTYRGDVASVSHPSFLESRPPNRAVVAVLGTEVSGRLHAAAKSVLNAAARIAGDLETDPTILLVTGADEEAWRSGLGYLESMIHSQVVLLSLPGVAPEFRSRFLADCWPELAAAPAVVIGEPWTEDALMALAARASSTRVALRVQAVQVEDGHLNLATSRGTGRWRICQTLELATDQTAWITLADGATAGPAFTAGAGLVRVQHWQPRLDHFLGQADIQRLLGEIKRETGLARLADADFIVDVGFGVGNRDGYEAVIEPLVRALQRLGVRNLVVGGSRKVTEELHLLPADRQIGQSGVRVNPQMLLAIGISGAPQHLSYIGTRATILAFNRDPEAPLMVLNQRQPQPRVYPVLGDLFETVPALTRALLQEHAETAERPSETGNGAAAMSGALAS
jgi:alkylation response protein AidB-like acyl-CoA dehydrogenase/electron transfer flavoprotein alpha subunit